MKKSELVNLLNKEFVFSNQEEWDKCGANLYQDENINNILIALDVTQDVIDFAINNNCNTIITHHPILVNDDKHESHINIYNQHLIDNLVKNNILHICLHTCFDKYKFGTSYQIYKSFNIPKEDIASEGWILDYIYYFELKDSGTLNDYLSKFDNKYTNQIKYLKEQKNKIIKKIAIGAGSCSSFLDLLPNYNIDCFLTGDIKWHSYIDAYNLNISIIDINHYAELVFVEFISKYISSNFKIKTLNFNKTLNIETK